MSISTLEASIKTGLSSGYISHLCRIGTILAEKKNNQWRIDEDALEGFVQKELVFCKKPKKNCCVEMSKALVEAFENNNLGISKMGVCRLIIKEHPEIGIRGSTIIRDFDIKKAPAERIDIYNKFFGISEDDLNNNGEVTNQPSAIVKKVIERVPVSPEGMTTDDLWGFAQALNDEQFLYFNMLFTVKMFYDHERKKHEGTTKSR